MYSRAGSYGITHTHTPFQATGRLWASLTTHFSWVQQRSAFSGREQGLHFSLRGQQSPPAYMVCIRKTRGSGPGVGRLSPPGTRPLDSLPRVTIKKSAPETNHKWLLNEHPRLTSCANATLPFKKLIFTGCWTHTRILKNMNKL